MYSHPRIWQVSHPGGQYRSCCEGEGRRKLGVEQAGPLESPRPFQCLQSSTVWHRLSIIPMDSSKTRLSQTHLPFYEEGWETTRTCARCALAQTKWGFVLLDGGSHQRVYRTRPQGLLWLMCTKPVWGRKLWELWRHSTEAKSKINTELFKEIKVKVQLKSESPSDLPRNHSH